jgi:hypothetical protein
MSIMRDEDAVAAAQNRADEDAHANARRLACVIHNFLPTDECDRLIGRVEDEGLLVETPSRSLHSMHADAEQTEAEAKRQFAVEVQELLWARLQALAAGNAGSPECTLHEELATGSEWSTKDYHVKHRASTTHMEMRLVGVSGKIRMMRYRPEDTGADTGTGTGTGSKQSFADPRTPHFDGRNHSMRGDSLLTMLLFLSDARDGDSVEGLGTLAGGRTLFLNASGEPVAAVTPRKGTVLIFDHHLYHQGEPVTAGQKYLLRSDLLYAPFDATTGEQLEFNVNVA